MTVPKWFIPLIAGIAAIAVGVAAALFATRFAAPETTTATPTTLDAPVLAPVAGSPTLEELVDQTEGDDIPISGVYGVETVVDPDSVPEGALPADVADLIDELGAADDPSEVLPEPAASDTPAGDPCADSDDPAALGCPFGTPGTIHALDGDLPALRVSTNSSHPEDCPAPENGSVRFVAQANAPVTITLRYNQTGHNVDVPGATETTPEQIADWERAVEESPFGVAWIDYCLTVTGLMTDRSVNVFVLGTDAIGRTDRPTYSSVVSDGLDIPPTRIHPVGDSTIFAAAPHIEGEVVRMFVVDREIEGTTTCRYDAAGAYGSFPTIGDPETEVVSAEYLAEYSYEADYTRRTTATFAVTAATQLFVCIGWFPARDSRPTFDRDTPLRVSEYAMTSPDVSAPRVVVSEVETFGEVAEGSVSMRASTENGQRCGDGWTLAQGAGTDLCDYGTLLGRFDAGGSMLVTTEVDVPEGHAVNRVLLDVSLLSCEGGCAGRTRYFDVPLSSFIRPTSICSGECGTNAGESVGIVRLRVTWPTTTTGEGWLLGDWREGADVSAPPLTPQLDLGARFLVGPSGLHPRAFSASASIELDRPVLASADLVTYAGEGITCPWPGGSSHWDGATSASTRFTVRFDGLCAGSGHVVVLTLTDPATDETVVYTIGHVDGPSEFSWWVDAYFTTPGIDRTVTVTSALFDLGDDTRLIRPDRYELWIGATDYSFGLPRSESQACWFGGIPNRISPARTVVAGETIRIQAEVRFRPGTDPGRPDTDDGRPTSCDTGGWRDEERIEFTGTISYDQLLAGPTVTLTDPETGYTLTLVLAAS